MPKTVEEMTDSERNRTEEWFNETLSGMTADEVILAGEIKDAPPGKVKTELNKLKGELLRSRSMLDRTEEAFFRKLAKSLDPPSDDDINETKRLTKALGETIAAEKASQAAVKLVDDLANFVSRVLA